MESPFPFRGKGASSALPVPDFPRRPLPPALKPLADGLEKADAFALDERLRHALSMEQRLDARLGPLLVRVWERWLHRALGYTTRDACARERLGMDPTRARALVRLERTAVQSQPFVRAYRDGTLSWVKAKILAPLVSADPLGWFVGGWVAWAGRVTVRRLRKDVERALALAETAREAFRGGGGQAPGARDDREIGAPRTVTAEPVAESRDDRGIGAGRTVTAGSPPQAGAPEEPCCARFIGPADVVQLFRALLCTVRRRIEQENGRPPASGKALGAMLDHALSSWGALDEKLAARHKVFARDGWRCPGESLEVQSDRAKDDVLHWNGSSRPGRVTVWRLREER